MERYVAKKLKLNAGRISTQIMRDRHAQYFSTLGIIAVQLKDLQLKSDIFKEQVLEVEEFFGKKQRFLRYAAQKNPILSENNWSSKVN